MGLSKAEEPTWLRQLGNVVKTTSKSSEEARVHPEGLLGDVPREPRQWCGAFEFADQMEQGLAPGLTSSFEEPLEGSETAEQRLGVQRSANRKEYLLSRENGEPLLLAVVNAKGDLFDIYIAKVGEPPVALGPAFCLKAKRSLKDWTLHSTRCEQCAARGRRNYGQRELARMRHYHEEVGVGKALCMDLRVPAPLSSEQGGSAIWCPVCSGPAPPPERRSSVCSGLSLDRRSSVCSGRSQYDASIASLTSRRPRWNTKLSTLTLDFRGRVRVASSKNFQLEVPGGDRDQNNVRLLFGKVADNQFILDFKRPLGVVQAFAAALTTVHWK